MTEATQTVKLFSDSEKTGVQEVAVAEEGTWINVIHDGNEISLSVENWKKLVALAETIINTNIPF